MKIEPRRAPPTAHQEDTTPEYEAGAEPRVHRRTTVTVERETISILVRRPVGGPATEPEGSGIASEPSGKNLPEALPRMPNDLTGDKP